MNNYRILIVEDSINLGLLYKQEFEECGYDVDIGRSVTEAILLLNQHHYDLVYYKPGGDQIVRSI